MGVLSQVHSIKRHRVDTNAYLMLSPQTTASSPQSPEQGFNNEQFNTFTKANVKRTDTNMLLLDGAMDAYIRNHMRQYKKSVKLCNVMQQVGQEEFPHLNQSIDQLVQLLNTREHSREQMAARMQLMALEPVRMYSKLCQTMLHQVKEHRHQMDTQKKKRHLAETAALKNTGDLQSKTRIGQAQIELANATEVLSRGNEALYKAKYHFDQQKDKDFKRSIQEFIWTEMAFHCRSLEILTEADHLVSQWQVSKE
ncbi:hypothetical protein EDD86DRAFT_206045 [Gorgonomyces haynaldii]|nr:hypothetical protein EDD86DRAFT_206045 [Gorgonomyces haynaldii]